MGRGDGAARGQGVSDTQAELLCSLFAPFGDCDSGRITARYPVREVTLDNDYWIDVYEVTNLEYRACVYGGICELPNTRRSPTRHNYYGNSEYDNYPVVAVTWYQAQTFCQEWRGKLISE